MGGSRVGHENSGEDDPSERFRPRLPPPGFRPRFRRKKPRLRRSNRAAELAINRVHARRQAFMAASCGNGGGGETGEGGGGLGGVKQGWIWRWQQRARLRWRGWRALGRRPVAGSVSWRRVAAGVIPEVRPQGGGEGGGWRGWGLGAVAGRVAVVTMCNGLSWRGAGLRRELRGGGLGGGGEGGGGPATLAVARVQGGARVATRGWRR